LAGLDTKGDELAVCRLDVGDNQVESLRRTGSSRRHLRTELDRAWGARRRVLDDAEAVLEREIGVEPPPQASVEALRTIDVGDRNDHDLELQVNSRGVRSLSCMVVGDLCAAHY